jgi:hypothetical protein
MTHNRSARTDVLFVDVLRPTRDEMTGPGSPVAAEDESEPRMIKAKPVESDKSGT